MTENFAQTINSYIKIDAFSPKHFSDLDFPNKIQSLKDQVNMPKLFIQILHISKFISIIIYAMELSF